MNSFGLLILVFVGLCSCTKNPGSAPEDISCIAETSAGKTTGYIKDFYDYTDQLKRVGHYQNGLRQGFWKDFYPNGQVQSEANYTKGKLDGFLKTYYNNGAVKSEGHIKNC